jgi:peptidoglycan/xylan/chitin deacetylase (PgdA/CDA1 family)
MIAALKRSSFAVSRQLGVMRLVADSAWRRGRLLVLCYHGVSLADEHQWNPGLYVSPATLARRLAILEASGCTVLPLGDAVRRLYAGTLPDRAVALTFDDGFYDFKSKALPLLQARGYPATLYVATQRCEQNYPIARLIASYVLWRHRAGVLDAHGMPGLDRVYDLSSGAERDRALADLTARMQREGLGPARKDALVREIFDRLGADYGGAAAARVLCQMTPQEIGEIARAGVDVELHTHRHRTPADPDAFVEEVRLNRRKLEAMTGRRPEHFCYPSGVYRMTYLPRLEAEGIATATTCDPDLASRGSHRLLLPRFVDTDLVSDLEFEAWVTGAAVWMPRRTRKGHVVH